MNTDNVLLIVCGVLIFVVLLNLGLLIGVLRGQSQERFKVIGKAIQAAQNPWRKSNEGYEELRKRVSNLGENSVEEEVNGSR
jgi:hypothetical protein